MTCRFAASRMLLVTMLWFVSMLLCHDVVYVVAADTVQNRVEDLEFFEERIRPVLVEKCYACHSQQAKPVQGELRVDTREAIRLGGASGPAVVPGEPEESLLLDAIRYESLEMPPKGKLPASVIADFERWIARGAADPREGTAVAAAPSAGTDLIEGRKFWAFQPVVKPAVPSNDGDWYWSDVDCFLMRRWREKGLRPTRDLRPEQLLRRVSFDLVGLPPDPRDVAAFVRDPSEKKFHQYVDQLLNSPRFGERWGRHWMDVVRFAESSGGGRSLMFPHAWRFRDYVIQALNEDMPFDQMVVEQIAGDLLPHRDALEQDRHRVATGFLALGPVNYELQDKELLRMEIVDEQLETVNRAFLGMSIGCARCHDHKFDPIPMTDYYGMAGVFTSTVSLMPGNVGTYVTEPLISVEGSADHREYAERYERLMRQSDKVKQEIAQAKKQTQPGIAEGSERPEPLQVLETQAKKLDLQLAELKRQKPPGLRPVAMTVREHQNPCDTHLLVRGVIRQHGPLVPRRFLSVASRMNGSDGTGDPAKIPGGASGRLELARWIASRENPLTGRVIVNRIWHWLLGRGIVATPDNFGSAGQRPTHPELLDYLAHSMADNGWSVKYIVRKIVLSHVYRLDTEAARSEIATDPANDWLARANRRRLDAESLRDAMLVVSGQMNGAMGGLTIRKISAYDLGYTFQTTRRSVYVPRFRNVMPDVFSLFDIANPNVTTGRRNVSILSTQALFFANSPFVRQASEQTAKRVLAESDNSAERIQLAFSWILNRDPTVEEQVWATHLLTQDPDETQRWANLCQLLFGSIEFRYLP